MPRVFGLPRKQMHYIALKSPIQQKNAWEQKKIEP